MQNPQYLVGIDLGTTHTVVAYAPIGKKNADISLFPITQLVAPGEVAERSLLPSVRYHLASGELTEDDRSFSPSGTTVAVIGTAARVLGAKTQGRLVSSAKSWLSHPSADASAEILPWGSDASVDKVSPLHASASYLAHVRGVWNQQFTDAPLEAQDIVITVPASFDEGARSLTLEAARLAGIKHCRLLEEPQAVCYDWLRRHQNTLTSELSDVKLLLVCDVGGGTTDLTLIKVKQQQQPELSRVGVGDHLMLGGDNIDLTLAHIAESRINGGPGKLSTADLSQLIEQCRQAKETLLQDQAPESCKVTLLGGGARLIGGVRSTELSREEVRNVALDGFFPLSKLDELPQKKRSGVVEFGLPYAAEPAVSKHIAEFLQHHRNISREAADNELGIPDALLLNGGVFRSKTISARALALLNHWRNDDKQVKLLDNIHPELAVAYGAVSYAQARRHQQLKIGGGAARSYFLLIDTQVQDAQQGICILPRDTEEGSEIVLQSREFALRLGQPVRFHLASLTGDSDFKPGDLTAIDLERFHSLPPLAVAFTQGQENAKEIKVQLAVALTEVGTLKLQCIAAEDPQQRWDVEFQIRTQRGQSQAQTAGLPNNFNQAAEQIRLIYGNKSKKVDPKQVKNLRATLEKLLGPRQQWQTPLLRELFTVLLEGSKNRKRSENHERIWLSLTGFCLRPGFGSPLDDWRVEQLWKLYPQAVQYVNATQHWTEWWTLWRRVAGGLEQEAQEKIFIDLSKYLNPASARQGNNSKQAKQRGYDDMVRLAAVLERLSAAHKIQLGEWLLKRLQKANEPEQTWWAVGRLGARILFHGSDHHVLPPDVVHSWLQQILTVDWKKKPQAGFAATLICRMSGDRSRDIDAELRLQVLQKLEHSKAPASWLLLVTKVKQLDEKEEKQIFGEALPPGLKLV